LKRKYQNVATTTAGGGWGEPTAPLYMGAIAVQHVRVTMIQIALNHPR